MRHSLLAPATLIALALASPVFAYAPAPPGRILPALGPKSPCVPGQVLVLAPRGGALKSTVTGGARSAALATRLEDLGIARVEPLGAEAPDATRAYDALRLVSDDPAFDPHAAARALVASGDAIAAAPNLRMTLHAVPNDPYYSTQWHLGTSAAGVRARQGWDHSTGSPSVTIGVMDTGVDRQHSDLFFKIWSNTAEIANNHVDDDHNGWVDDVQGWDFGDGDANPDPGPLPDPIYGLDEGWHGTFVAGLAAAATDNGVGIAGVAWGCRVVPLKVSDVNGDMTLSAIVDAFHYAMTVHVSVLNISLGTSDPSAEAFFQELVDAATAAGVVVVASAGNAGVDTPSFPAACNDVLAVGATNASNLRASWSNWGDWVDIAAPGEGVWSCIARNYPYDDLTWWYFETYCGFDGAHAYLANDGTSFSAPIVAGAAALVRSLYPGLPARMVAQQLVVKGDLRTYDNPIGPRLDIERALTRPLAADDAPAPHALALAPPSPNPAHGATRFAFALPRAGYATLELLDAQGRRVRTLFDGEAAAGTHAAEWDLRDGRGGPAPAGLYFARLSSADRHEVRRVVVMP
ncbi:MAG: S8 family serine peptidase [Candidatus Eisenbacteria bacterium]|uniref:S8 family serine peptidase n=1 Tax=Eiseniibacteriota bacterium TaxID=2212470 RepID=A0A933WA84_UNCEI|nr:S8 family serine peptidase [Candidatus Eisenbacteria bacterium]